MATNYPGSLDSFVDPTDTEAMNAAGVDHATEHANANDAIAAIETHIGTTAAPNFLPSSGGTMTGALVINNPTEYASSMFQISTTTAGTLLEVDRISSGGGASRLTIYGASDSTAPAIIALQAPNGTDYADWTFDGNNCELDLSKGALSLRPLASGGNVQVYSPSYTAKFRVGNAGFTQALDFSHDGTNAHVTATTGYIGFATGDAFKILSTGAVNYSGPTAASATAGSNGAPPSAVGGYLTWQVGGTTVHVPYYL